MSDYETHKGKIRKVETDLSPVEFARSIIGDKEVKYYDMSNDEDVLEYFRDEYSEQYVIMNNTIYSIENKELDGDADIFQYEKLEDGSIEYLFRFYNGGTCLHEQIESVLEEVE